MTETTVLAEVATSAGDLPWFEIPGWRADLGVVAGVTGRGDPARPFDLGLAGDGPIGAVLERWRMVGRSFAGFDGVVVARQVHGVRVLWHEQAADLTIREGADGHATAKAGILLAVSLADCVPVYVVDPVRRAVALLHSGWRGTAGRIIGAGISALRDHAGSRPGDLIVHAGVGICQACYEVGADVASACGQPAASSPTHLDLRAVIAEQALAEGVGRVSVSSECSAHQRDRFMSHRGSGGRDGRMVALLGFPTY